MGHRDRTLRPCSASRPRAARATAWLVAIVSMLGIASPAQGQGPWWGWGKTTGPTAVWDPSRFADYLYSGHEPHPAVARIVAPEQDGTALGSGVLVDVNRSQGLVLTNWHVVRDSRSALLVQFGDGFQSAGTVVRWDQAWDLAAVVIWKPAAMPVTIAPTAPLVGESLTIAGFGRGIYREETGPCTEYLSPGTGYAKEFVELRATARQGDSGGPIFNERRELAGVLFGQSQGRTIGSCSTRVRTFLEAVGSKGFTALPIAEFSTAPAITRGLGTDPAPPARIASSDGPLERATHVPSPIMNLGQIHPQLPHPEAPPPYPGSGFGLWSPPNPAAPAVSIQPPSAPSTRTVAPSPQSASPESATSAPRRSAASALLRAALAERENLLVGAGGLALALVGLRIVFGGRRFSASADA